MRYLLLILTLMYGCGGMEYKWSLGCHPVRPVKITWWLTTAEYSADLCEMGLLPNQHVACTKLDCTAGICTIFSSLTEEEASKTWAWDKQESLKQHELNHCDGDIHD